MQRPSLPGHNQRQGCHPERSEGSAFPPRRRQGLNPAIVVVSSFQVRTDEISS